MFLNFVFLLVHIAQIRFFSQMKEVNYPFRSQSTAFWPITQQQEVCFLTINYDHNEFAELQIGKYIF